VAAAGAILTADFICREYNPRLALAERDVLITIVGYAMIKAEIKFYG